MRFEYCSSQCHPPNLNLGVVGGKTELAHSICAMNNRWPCKELVSVTVMYSCLLNNNKTLIIKIKTIVIIIIII